MAESETLLCAVQELVQLTREQRGKGTTPVLFEAELVTDTKSLGYIATDQLTFPNIKRNEGGGQSETGDVFVVPVRGTYAFSFNISNPMTGFGETGFPSKVLQLRVNGVELFLTAVFLRNDWKASTVLSLDKGKCVTVWAHERQRSLDGQNGVHVTFSGTLMHES
uniref:Type 2 C1q domain-containing protein 11 n=1 Tax=Littorina littorea TaxID=31216 RepID=A0A411DEN8_LITLI|nr:type 2 C1q domain-containing protein 11 [Littorina littorea]